MQFVSFIACLYLFHIKTDIKLIRVLIIEHETMARFCCVISKHLKIIKNQYH